MKRPALMGVVNVTPDSFSDGGRMAEAALAHAKALVAAGADILDFGAESTRPGAVPVTPDTEWARLEPVLAALYRAPWAEAARISIDTRHAQTAARALAMGVHIINDVGGLNAPEMLDLLGNHGCDVVVMHALSIPADAAVTLPEGADVIQEILHWKKDAIARAEAAGIEQNRLIFDPGIGFGKTAPQSLALMLGAAELVQSGGRWLYGHSRKSFLSVFSDVPASERDALTLAFSAQLAHADVPYLRVHDLAGHHAMFAKLCT